jgi:Right handed beta helix region
MSGQLIPQLLFQGWSPNGGFLSGGLLYTFQAGTNIPATVYGDPGLTGALTNPVQLNSLGEALIYLTPGQAYKFNLTDSNGNQIPGYPVDQVNSALSFPSVGSNIVPSVNNLYTLGTPSLSWAAVYVNGAPVPSYPISASETAASVIPTALQYIWGDVRRYGADPTGLTDSTGPINNALASNTQVYAIGGSYLVSGTLLMKAGQTFYGDGSGTVLNFTSAAINISMVSVVKSTVRDMKIVVTGVAMARTAGVYLQFCTACTVERVEMTGCMGYGVWLDCSNQCQIENNYFHGFGDGATSNYADVGIYCASSPTLGAVGNRILNNVCMGGNNEFGIALEDPDSATAQSGFPMYNLVSGNKVGPHTGYGILLYMSGSALSPPPACDTYNQVIGNTVAGVTGAIASNTSSGAGIYAVGTGIGGTVIANNVVNNCCISTSAASLAPAGIGLNSVLAGITRPVISGNVINGMTQGHGILVVSSPGGAVVGGNSINMPSTNAGSGPGGSALLGNGVTINASSNVSVGPNEVQVYGSGAGIGVLASAVNASNINFNGGNYQTAGTGGGFVTAQSGGFNINRLALTGVNFICTGAPDAMNLVAVAIGNLANCTGSATGGRGLFLNGSTKVRVTGGEYSSTGSTVIGTSGTCTGSFVDKSVLFGGVSSTVSNAGTGCIIEWYVNSSSIPTTGTFAVGDHAIPLAPVVGSPKGWFTTVAGTPGTQSSEGTL